MPVYQVYDSATDGLVYHVEPDHQTCQAETISDVTSDVASIASGMTIQSDDLPGYFIERHGLQQPASDNAVHWFPTDNAKRYILRHVLTKYFYGHNYVGPVKNMLWSDPEVGKRHHVLEIGTRDGTWTQEMATEFPHVQFRSLDIVPIIAHIPRPNLVFEVYDISEGLLLENGSQDIVFVNMAVELVSSTSISSSMTALTRTNDKIKDYRALLLEIYRVLRPGGLVHIRECALGLWDWQDDTKFARRTNPIGCRVFDLVRSMIANLGVDPDTCEKLPTWLASNSDLWKGFNQAGGFERIHTVVKTWPYYPHDDHPCSAHLDPRLGPLIAHMSVVSARDSSGLLRDAGLGSEEVYSLIEAMVGELKDPNKCTAFKSYCVYATKKG